MIKDKEHLETLVTNYDNWMKTEFGQFYFTNIINRPEVYYNSEEFNLLLHLFEKDLKEEKSMVIADYPDRTGASVVVSAILDGRLCIISFDVKYNNWDSLIKWSW